MGDVLVTSGLDGVYLAGLPVAKIAAIDRNNSFMFARIHCAPLAGVESHGQVLLLGARSGLPAQPAEASPTADDSTATRRVKKRH